MLKEALFYNYNYNNEKVECNLCPHNCNLLNNNYGICKVRLARGKKLFTINYGAVTSIALDPIEKKPLYHFYPGSKILSIGTFGCNLKCPFCQNWQISQETDIKYNYLSPDDLIKLVKEEDSIGIAYTYSEPIVWFEYIYDCAKKAKRAGLKNVMVTNGFIANNPLEKLLPLIDAWNVDLKTFNEKTYRTIIKGDLEIVKKNIQKIYKNSHLEVTTLIVTDLNDKIEELTACFKWLASIDKNIPWHISRYYPAYKYNKSSTDIEFMLKIFSDAKLALNNVYCGNISIEKTQNSFCHNCGALLVIRNGYSIESVNLKNNICKKCNHKVYFINN